MSALIKPGSAADIRAFVMPALPRETATVASNPVDDERVALAQEVERLTRALAEARMRAEKTEHDARQEGYAAGLLDAAKLEKEHISALGEALSSAVVAFENRLAVLDGLAPALVRASLAKLFDAPEHWSEMRQAMLARQLSQLRRASVVAIHVSPQDFADPAELAAMESATTRVVLDPDLRVGACRVECKLGQVDIDVRQQWAALAALLEEMEAE